MKTRTTAFDQAWGDRTRKRVWKIELKRRYWNGAAYIWESSPIILRERDIVDISPITRRIDDKGAVRISNVTVRVTNQDNEWMPGNFGIWSADGVALQGYDPINSEMRVYAGYVLDDGTEELLPMFAGRVDEEPQFDSDSGVASFSLLGLAETKLKNANAQNVTESLTNQTPTPGSGDGSNKSFKTLTSVWDISPVKVNAVVKTQGSDHDYTLDDLNDAELPARIEFTDASVPPAAQPVRYDARRWFRDKSAATLVGYLCDEAGIAAPDRIIEEPVFQGVDQFKDVPDTGWITEGTLVSNGDFEVVGDLTAWSAAAINGGSWDIAAGSGYGASNAARLFINTTTTGWTTRVQLIPTSGPTITKDITGTISALSRQYVMAGPDAPYTIKFTFFLGGVERGSLTSPSTTSAKAIEFYLAQYAGIGVGFNFPRFFILDYVREITNVVSPEQDLLAAPVSWLPLSIGSGSIPASEVKTKTASASGGPYDAFVFVAGNYTPLSVTRRYIKIGLIPSDASMTTPGTTARINWRGGELFFKSADFTGFRSCAEAIAAIADFTGMDQGSRDDGVFFFQNRLIVGTADMVLHQANAVQSITNLSLGYRDVRNRIQVRYGKSGTSGYYFAEYGAVDAGEASPTSEQRFGQRVREIVMDRFIFSNSAAVADAIAAKAFAGDYRPQKKGRAACRFIPQIELRDRVDLSFHRSPLKRDQVFGDPLQTVFSEGGTNNAILRNVLVKVTGKTDNIIQGTTLLDWEEILT